MIAGCIDKMRQGSCAGCERRDNCDFLWPEALGFLLRAKRSMARPDERRSDSSRNPFFSFLGEMAKAVEDKVGEHRIRERQAKPRPGPFRAEVERHLEPLLASGEVGIDRVARELGYSRQTLYRRLKGEGVTFEQLLDGLRRRLAIGFISEQGLSVKDAAYRLGFSDPAAFSRAFKRWTGASPRSARKR